MKIYRNQFVKRFDGLTDIIVSKNVREQFLNELTLVNIHRLQSVLPFVMVFSAFLIIADTYLNQQWTPSQMRHFIALDSLLLLISTYYIIFFNLAGIRKAQEVKKIHYWHINIFYWLVLLWASSVSAIEATEYKSALTFIAVSILLSTLFYTRPWFNGLSLAAFLGYLLVTFVFTDNTLIKTDPVGLYGPLILVTILDVYISRTFFISRVNNFVLTKDLTESRNKLDIAVKVRTSELVEANRQLRNEIQVRKDYENRLKEESEKVVEADRLKTAFLANMSHEIRTPLNGIIGFASLMYNLNPSAEKRKRYAELIQMNSQQLLQIVDDIMDLSMIESNQLKLNCTRINLDYLLGFNYDVFDSFRHSQNKMHVELRQCSTNNDNPRIFYSDETRINQILGNLLKNALIYTESGFVQFGAEIQEPTVRFTIQDTGVGIPKDIEPKIFNRFFQGDNSMNRKYGGTGLGLAIAKGILEKIGGRIWIDYTSEKGTQFCFEVPTNCSSNHSSNQATIYA